MSINSVASRRLRVLQNTLAPALLAPMKVAGTSTVASAADVRLLREDLAAAYRICAANNMNEAVCNHITAACRYAGASQGSASLVIRHGLDWSECTPDDLLLFDNHTEKVLEGEGHVEITAMKIHAAIHRARPEVVAVFHTHMAYATALTSLADPVLKMINQNCLRFHENVAYDFDYRGLVEDDEEGGRLASVLGPTKNVLMLQNHGVIVLGDTVAQVSDPLSRHRHRGAGAVSVRGHLPTCANRAVRPAQAWDDLYFLEQVRGKGSLTLTHLLGQVRVRDSARCCCQPPLCRACSTRLRPMPPPILPTPPLLPTALSRPVRYPIPRAPSFPRGRPAATRCWRCPRDNRFRTSRRPSASTRAARCSPSSRTTPTPTSR